MNCAPFDLRDYYFEELGAAERRQVREHVDLCGSCAAELDRLRLTALSLATLPEQEIPRRIAFVSDKVFEPSPVRRWWLAFWSSGSRTVAAAAMVLAGAIVFHAVRPPSPSPPAVQVVRGASTDADPEVLKAAIDQAVAEAVAKSEFRYDAKLRQVEARNATARQQLMVRVGETLDYLQKSRNVFVASNDRSWAGQ